MKTDYCFMLLFGSAVSLAACTKGQDSAASSPETPHTGAPQDDTNTSAPGSDVDHGASEERMGPQAPRGAGEPADGSSGPTNPPGSAGPMSGS